MYYLYLLLCEDGSIYTGVSDNPSRRFTEHKTKSGGRYTKLHEVIKMVRVENFQTKSEASKRERQIKGWRRDKKINLIKFDHPLGEQKL